MHELEMASLVLKNCKDEDTFSEIREMIIEDGETKFAALMLTLEDETILEKLKYIKAVFDKCDKKSI